MRDVALPPPDNIDITHDELQYIRRLSDFDLTMFLSELDELGWPLARKLLHTIAKQTEMQGHEGRPN